MASLEINDKIMKTERKDNRNKVLYMYNRRKPVSCNSLMKEKIAKKMLHMHARVERERESEKLLRYLIHRYRKIEAKSLKDTSDISFLIWEISNDVAE